MKKLLSFLPDTTLATLTVRLFGWRKIPLVAHVRPSVLKFDESEVVVRIPLRRRTKNHLNSMYFGALTIGADLAGGLLAMHLIRKSERPIALIFKSLEAEFLKRAEADVHFSCADGAGIAELVKRAEVSEERVEMPVRITATAPAALGDEPVAEFTLVLSLKARA